MGKTSRYDLIPLKRAGRQDFAITVKGFLTNATKISTVFAEKEKSICAGDPYKASQQSGDG
ncbi:MULTISPECIES: hypothetical protein [Bacillus]|uniref:hypothetical protein n=1 Tax=Bacillus TaxID=1386 RepID=UPI000FD7F10B|nr:hypothetical protein [Bacillus amyloliquefaciens]MBW8280325.1 hypothetical protein [Bacillus amyloliquefaciens]MCY7423365.1 hypothetical protein [Bacillus amyloliquefaciens]MDR4378450.1 hypothetical protein [Bacillus amyloliquefaciens]MEC1014800.1 hypothetical protein [Bacillus amyloliquefaciens]MEC1249205.1 hypothetical protein [Bacillus amyloliquefaciens]